MEKNIKKNIEMSLETAREHYKPLMKMEAPSMTVFERVLLNMIITTFTKEELEGDEGYTWEKAFSGDGYYIHNLPEMKQAYSAPNGKIQIKMFKTEAQAKSALAFAQLSHICAAANEGKEMRNTMYSVVRKSGELKVYVCIESEYQIMFYTEQDAETSLRVNRELWEQYHML